MKNLIFASLLFLSLSSCGNAQEKKKAPTSQNAVVQPVQTPMKNGLKKAYFASGCFWCVGLIYDHIKGVKNVIYGYAGGHTKNPTYRQTGTGKTGHAETVEITYDPKIVSYKTLLDVYFGSQNAIQQNGQGPDWGSEYRSIIFYQNQKEKKIIEDKMASLNPFYSLPIAAEVVPFQKFWKAEGYHQDYYKKNPESRYIQQVSIPRYKEFAKKFPELIKQENKEK